MNKIIRYNKKYIFSLMLSAIAIAASSCGSNQSGNNPENIESPVASSPLPTPTSEIQPPEIDITTTPSPTPKTVPFGTQTPPSSETPNQNKTASSKNVDITVYTSDLQCQELVPKKVSVSVDEPVKDAVGRIIAEKDSGDFNISNYRVNVNNGIATVDLRLSPNSPRQLTSLSSCEQFALFGSLKKTLTSNPKWNIKDVRFTEAGEEIIL
ncbi:MAG: sporulation/spore germination protein [Richelia sp. RM2_1_2]|nr:sporulation/spore germination protein [Richelia sp. SM1_7_0]NJN07329.1 sporulation/spore germination protein [Richelia sp. RM1_1_1]NJO30980.1 sporulation/spore germination protein [Richelia sp. SL_2_1]NJO64666.1 sporulation/spore germination protein [Richelia sp. RM2_1_2]NJS16448.1 sporulation/spore germination protein [Nostocaceae cyanobacterium CSU_2_110]